MSVVSAIHRKILEHRDSLTEPRVADAALTWALRTNDTETLCAVAEHGDRTSRNRLHVWCSDDRASSDRRKVAERLARNRSIDDRSEADTLVAALSTIEALRCATDARNDHVAAALLARADLQYPAALRIAGNRAISAQLRAAAVERLAGAATQYAGTRKVLTSPGISTILSEAGPTTLRWIARADALTIGEIAGIDRPDEATALLARIRELTATHPELGPATSELVATLEANLAEHRARGTNWLLELATNTNPADLDTLVEHAGRTHPDASDIAEAVWANPAASAAHRAAFAANLTLEAEQRIAAAAATAADVAAICAASGNPTLLDYTSLDPVDICDAMVATGAEPAKIASTFSGHTAEPGPGAQIIAHMPAVLLGHLDGITTFHVVDALLGSDDTLWEALDTLGSDPGKLTIGELCANIRAVAATPGAAPCSGNPTSAAVTQR